MTLFSIHLFFYLVKKKKITKHFHLFFLSSHLNFGELKQVCVCVCVPRITPSGKFPFI